MTLLIAGTIKISIVLLAALLLCAALRRRSAALRHWLLAASLAGAAAMPALNLVVPAWSLPGAGALLTPALQPSVVALSINPCMMPLVHNAAT